MDVEQLFLQVKHWYFLLRNHLQDCLVQQEYFLATNFDFLGLLVQDLLKYWASAGVILSLVAKVFTELKQVFPNLQMQTFFSKSLYHRKIVRSVARRDFFYRAQSLEASLAAMHCFSRMDLGCDQCEIQEAMVRAIAWFCWVPEIELKVDAQFDHWGDQYHHWVDLYDH